MDMDVGRAKSPAYGKFVPNRTHGEWAAPTARKQRPVKVAKTVRERALELAISGKCQTVSDVLFWLRVRAIPGQRLNAR